VIKVKMDHGDCKTDYAFANDKFETNAMGVAVNDADWNVKVGAGGVAKQDKNDYKLSFKSEIHGKDVGGAQAHLKLDYDHNWCQEENKTTKKMEDVVKKTLKPTFEVAVDNKFFVGAFTQFDMNNNAMKKCFPHFFMVNSPTEMFWARANVVDKLAFLGADYSTGDGIWHTMEAWASWDANYKGFMGKPGGAHAGGSYELDGRTQLGWAASVAADYEYSAEVEHEFNSNWTGKVFHGFSSENLSNKKPTFSHGFSMAYKL
jgi:hypothetical protein